MSLMIRHFLNIDILAYSVLVVLLKSKYQSALIPKFNSFKKISYAHLLSIAYSN